jgi:hypothetical protein
VSSPASSSSVRTDDARSCAHEYISGEQRLPRICSLTLSHVNPASSTASLHRGAASLRSKGTGLETASPHSSARSRYAKSFGRTMPSKPLRDAARKARKTCLRTFFSLARCGMSSFTLTYRGRS